MATKPLAIIVKGNPKYLRLPEVKPMAEQFYSDLHDRVASKGYEVRFDEGKPYTSPDESAEVWIGHSRGADRLDYAPNHIKTIYLQTNDTHHIHGIADRTGRGPKHYQLSSRDLEALDSLMPNKYLDHIEKQSSLIAGAVGTHVAQNVATRAALSSKKISKYLANSFAEGTKGVVNTSIKSRAARLLAGATVPDIAVAHRTAHEFGKSMAPILGMANKRQQVGLRMLSEGRISDIHKYGLHKDPIIQAAHGIASAKLGLKNGVDELMHHAPHIEKIFQDKSHPLASNILKNISRGHTPVGKNFKPGNLNSKTPLLGAAASIAAEPAGGALNTVKTLATSKTFGNTRIGAKINGFLENQFVKKPVQSGVDASKLGKHISNLKHKATGLLVNPVSAQLKRTSAAITDALK